MHIYGVVGFAYGDAMPVSEVSWRKVRSYACVCKVLPQQHLLLMSDDTGTPAFAFARSWQCALSLQLMKNALGASAHSKHAL